MASSGPCGWLEAAGTLPAPGAGPALKSCGGRAATWPHCCLDLDLLPEGSQVSPATVAPCLLLEGTLAWLLGPTLTRESRFLQLCLQGKDAHRCGLEHGKSRCQILPAACPYHPASRGTCAFPDPSSPICAAAASAAPAPSAALGQQSPGGPWSFESAGSQLKKTGKHSELLT